MLSLSPFLSYPSYFLKHTLTHTHAHSNNKQCAAEPPACIIEAETVRNTALSIFEQCLQLQTRYGNKGPEGREGVAGWLSNKNMKWMEEVGTKV